VRVISDADIDDPDRTGWLCRQFEHARASSARSLIGYGWATTFAGSLTLVTSIARLVPTVPKSVAATDTR
jgi:hypothetical protein